MMSMLTTVYPCVRGTRLPLPRRTAGRAKLSTLPPIESKRKVALLEKIKSTSLDATGQQVSQDDEQAPPQDQEPEESKRLMSDFADELYATTASPKPRTNELRFNLHQWVRPQDFTFKSRRSSRVRPLVPPSTPQARYRDIFRQRGINPLKEILNAELLSHYVSRSGRILNRRDTELSSKSQRMLGKAIRRAKMLGVIPWLNKQGSASK